MTSTKGGWWGGSGAGSTGDLLGIKHDGRDPSFFELIESKLRLFFINVVIIVQFEWGAMNDKGTGIGNTLGEALAAMITESIGRKERVLWELGARGGTCQVLYKAKSTTPQKDINSQS